MGIQSLPASAIRAIGSGQVLTDSVSLVKELLDNSLDASATQISVEVSHNCLDVIQVKDNGHGISESDRDSMAVRYCTSKISDYGDIQNCRSLGFRGEALASAAELSGGLAITTRVEGETVATVCTCDKNGKVIGRKPVGAPQGTIVRITDFFKYLPVRRENALKSAEKSLARLRTLIQKYYLSHPACRFSLRIMASPQKGKGGGSKGEDKVYAPSKTVTEAVLKAVGKDVAAACQWITTSDTNITEEAEQERENEPHTGPIRIDALLPRPDIDPTILCKKPQCTHFVYIDDRPVSCARGTLKQILTLYKSYLKSVLPPTSNISDPFVFLNLRCPPGTYDPNIEPAKDDVLFFNIAGVLGAVEMLLKGAYGELQTDTSGTDGTGERPGRKVSQRVRPGDGFGLLLAKKKISPPPPRSDPPAVGEEEEELAAREVDLVINSEAGYHIQGFTPVNKCDLASTVPQKTNPKGILPQEHKERPPMFVVTDISPPRPHAPDRTPQLSAAVPPIAAALRTPVRRPTNWGFNMSGGYDGDDDLLLEEAQAEAEADDGPTREQEEDDERGARDISISNPWTAAKMNSPIVSASSSAPGVIGKQRPFRPPARTRPPQEIGSSPPRPPSPPLHYSTSTSRSGPRRMTTAFPTPGAFPPPSGPQGNPEVMESWIRRTPRRAGNQRITEAVSPTACREPLDEDYNEERDYPEKRPREPRPKIRTRVVENNPKRRRLNETEHHMEEMEDAPLWPEGHDNDTGRLPPPYKSPHRNRFLRAAAALSSQPGPGPELEPEPEPELEPDLELVPIPPEPVRKRTRSIRPLEVAPDKASQTKHLTKKEECPLALLAMKFAKLRDSDQHTLVSLFGELAVERAIQGTVGALLEMGGMMEEAIVAGVVKTWLAGKAREVGVTEVGFQVEFEGGKMEGEGEEGGEEAGEPREMRVLRVIWDGDEGNDGEGDYVDLF